MSKFPELSNEEIFDVLLCGGKPREGYAIQDYVDEWNDRVANGERFQVDVPPIDNKEWWYGRVERI